MKGSDLNIKICGATLEKEKYWERLALLSEKFNNKVPEYFLRRILGAKENIEKSGSKIND